MIDELNRDDAFAERVAKPLRAPERADETFEARVLTAVQAAGRKGAHQPVAAGTWWLRPRTVRVTPLAALALAAALSAVVLGSASLVRRAAYRELLPTAQAASPDTVHVVRFVFVDSNARSVSIVGAFNGWEKNATMLYPTGKSGVWSVSIPLDAGRHEYAFIVSDAKGEHWIADPLGEPVHDEYGTESSAIFVGTQT